MADIQVYIYELIEENKGEFEEVFEL